MFAFLKLVPGHIWFYLALIMAASGAFTWYTLHIEAKTHAADVAADQRVVDARKIHDAEVTARAQTLTDKALAAYRATVAAPPAADAPHLVCRHAPGGGAVRADDGGAKGSNGAVDDQGGRQEDHGGPEYDPGPPLDKLHEDADAKIKLLQDYVNACIAAGRCKAPQ